MLFESLARKVYVSEMWKNRNGTTSVNLTRNCEESRVQVGPNKEKIFIILERSCQNEKGVITLIRFGQILPLFNAIK